TCPIELLGRSEACWPRADDGDFLAGPDGRALRCDPLLGERALDDRDLDGLDADRIVVDAEYARALTGRRAEPPGEFGKVVRRVQALDRLVPVIAIDEIVPVRNDVAEWTTLKAKGNPGVHAARRLALEIGLRVGEIDLVPVAQALGDGPRRPLLPLDLEEAGDFTHWRRPPARRRSARGLPGRPAPRPSGP